MVIFQLWRSLRLQRETQNNNDVMTGNKRNKRIEKERVKPEFVEDIYKWNKHSFIVIKNQMTSLMLSSYWEWRNVSVHICVMHKLDVWLAFHRKFIINMHIIMTKYAIIRI